MKFHETPLSGAFVVELEKFGDDRGFFARAFCRKEFEERGLTSMFVQVNDSLSAQKGTLRGMHYQVGECAETKLVRCIKGALFDVILDMRLESPTFGKHFGVELSEGNRKMLYVPKGFAHSFITLEDDTEAFYFVDAFYEPGSERGVRWNDPKFDVKWPEQPTVISDKDASWPDFNPDYHFR